jgi:K+ transporter
LGVVFGDIGTSPLYTLKTVLSLTAGTLDPSVTLGVLSLVIWTLIVVTTIKYVSVAMSVDNDGEGGILALLSLLGAKQGRRPVIIAVGLFGAALIYGDGAITPAISVLSALEGLNIVAPALSPYVLPVSVLILIALFAIQPQGTARIGRAFGPIMAVWFVTIAALGIWGISRHPSVLVAIDPRYGLSYLFSGRAVGFLVLGAVFLCVTGAEALYADMGHFGARPIRLAWSVLVFPSLVLNYAGQAALVLDGAPVSNNIFYRLCPSFLLVPLIVLATIATIIASQSIITGAFSMTRQAIQLGWLPQLQITQTSAEGYGQIYVGTVNWLLMLVTLGLTVGFGKSDNLAAARLQEQVVPVGAFMAKIAEGQIPRVPGTAVFLTRTQRNAPPVMVWHLKHNRALHERLIVLTVNTEPVPCVKGSERLAIEEMVPRFRRASARYGFMERPDIPVLLREAHERGCAIDLADITYYVGHETVTTRDDSKGLPKLVEALFALMQRNSAHLTDYFKLPPDAVVEIGRQVSI